MRESLMSTVPFITVLSLTGSLADAGGQKTLKELVPEYGHRNWIVVADSAYKED